MLLLLGACLSEPVESRFRVGGELIAVHVDVAYGEVRLIGADQPQVDIRRRTSGPVQTTQRLEDGILYLSASCTAMLPCDAELELTLPATMPVDVRLQNGNVQLLGMSSDLHVEIGDGELVGESLRSPSLRGRLGWGDAWLRFVEVPRDIILGAGVGDLRVSVPRGPYALDVEALAGTEVNQIEDQPDGPRLSLHTASGRLTLIGE